MKRKINKIFILSIIIFLNFFIFIVPAKATVTGDTYATSAKRTDLNPLGNLQVSIPGVKELAEKYPVKCSGETGNTNCEIPWIAIYIYAIYNYMLAIGGMLAVVTIMIGGVIWLVSAGNASRISTAKSWIVGSLTGLLILLTSYVLLYQINPEMVDGVYIDLKIIDPILAETEMTSPADYNGSKIYPSSQWITIPKHSNITNTASGKANPELVQAIIKAADCMKKNGYTIVITSLSRTVESQVAIYDDNYNHEQNKCGTKKGKSFTDACCPYPTESKMCPHTSGNAVDMWGYENGKKTARAQTQLQNCMFEAGTCLLNSECWHFELPVLSKSACGKTNNLNGSHCSDIRK